MSEFEQENQVPKSVPDGIPASPEQAISLMQPEPARLYTTRQYPCGCRAEGPGDVPNYCSEHGEKPLIPEYESPFKPLLERVEPYTILVDALNNPDNDAESTEIAHEVGAAVAAETSKPRVPDHSVLGAPYDLKSATVEHGIQVREGLWGVDARLEELGRLVRDPETGICNMCGAAHQPEATFGNPATTVRLCEVCSTEICERCQRNHEFGCKQMAAKKARKLGPTVRPA